MPVSDEAGCIHPTLEDYSPKDFRFTQHRKQADVMGQLFAISGNDGVVGFMAGNKLIIFSKYAVLMAACGGYLEFVKGETGLKLVNARFCKTPMCPMCQWRRSLKWRSKFFGILPEIQEKYPTHFWVFLTLTIRNCDIGVLKDTLRHLNGSFNRLSKLKKFPMDGYIKSIEVTRAWDCYHKGAFLGRHGTKWIVKWEFDHKAKLDLEPTNEVHPHLHVMGLVPASYNSGHSYLNQKEWTRMWKESLRIDYDPIVHIKKVRNQNRVLNLPNPEELLQDTQADKSGMIQAICETLKYTVKEKDLLGEYCKDENVNSDWLKALTEQLYNTRKVEYRGCLKDFKKKLDEDPEKDDLIKITNDKEVTEESDLEMISFSWYKSLENYILRTA